MKNYSIVFTKPNQAELLQSEANQQLKENQVLVRLHVTSISSGTERALITGDPNVSVVRDAEYAAFPRQSGYSGAGVVVAVGEKVKNVAVGDRVAGLWGNHSKYCVYSEEYLLKLDDRVSFAEAALCNIATFPLSAIRKCRLEIGESAIVMGLGVLGMIAVKLLKIAGAYPIIAVDPVAQKREEALAQGADFAFDPYSDDFVKQVKEVTGGGVKVAIEVTGVGVALDSVLDCMARFGRVALLGCTRHADININYYFKVHGPGITLIGAHSHARPEKDSSNGWWTHHDDADTILKLIAGGRLTLQNLVGETHNPEDAPQVYSRLISEKGFPTVQFDWETIGI